MKAWQRIFRGNRCSQKAASFRKPATKNRRIKEVEKGLINFAD